MEDRYEELGQQIDTLENLYYALSLNLPDHLHVKAMRESMPVLITRMKESFVKITGENPWE